MLREVDKIFFTVNNNVSGLAVKFNLHDHVSDRFKTNVRMTGESTRAGPLIGNEAKLKERGPYREFKWGRSR